MKKLTLFSVIAMAFVAVSCYPTRIVTVSPSTTYGHSTTISYPNHSTTQIYASDYDLCLHLDLQAVGAAFAQAYTVKEFEMLLNSPNYMISNLDLNRDGYIDYLRVVEAVDRYTHMFVIQAVLGRNMFQDVATLIVENPSYAGTYVEIIGAPFIYGPKYIVRPIYKSRPNIYAHLCVRGYSPWVSPWHWDYLPTYYKRPVPVHLSHYQAYVTTYMHNHRFCHEVLYPSAYHYSNYDHMTQHIQRNDYGAQHPEQSFVNRTAETAGSNSAVRRAQNALDIQQAQRSAARSATTSSASSSTSTASRTAATSGSTSASRSGATTSGNASASRSSATSGSNASASRSSATTSNNASASRSSATTSNNTSASRSGATTNNSAATRSSSSSSASRSSATTSSGTSSTGSSSATTVSRVSSSGSSRTTTTTSSGTTARRSSTSDSGSTATRSSASSTSSSSAARTGSSTSSTTRSSGSTATRSGSSSTSSSTSTSSSAARGRR